jgi:hypothetical protein
LISEKSTSQQQHSLGENDTTIKLSQGDDVIHKINFTSTTTSKYAAANLDFRFMPLVGGFYVYHSRNKECATCTFS